MKMELYKIAKKPNAKWYLSIGIIGSLIIAALIILCLMIWKSYKETIIGIQESQMLVTVQSMSNSMENTLNSYVADGKMLAATAVGENGEIYKSIMENYLANQSFLVDLSVKNADGDILWDKSPQDFSKKILTAKLNEDNSFSVWSDSAGKLFFVFSSTAKNKDNVCLVLDVSKYYELFSKIRVGSEGYIILKSSSGVILMHPEASQIGIGVISGRENLYPQLDYSSLKKMIERQENGETGIADYYSYWWTEPDLPRVRKIAAYTPVPIGSDFLILSVDMDYNDIYQPVVQGFSRIIMIFTGILTVVSAFIVFSFILARKNRKNAEEIQYLKNLNHVLEETHKGEEALAHQQRLQIMGTMTGGIAHEFNNMLTPIMGYADLLMGTLPQGSDEYDSVREIFEASEKAKDVIRQISSMSRKNMETAYRFIEADNFLKRAVKMIRTICPYNISIEVKTNLEDAGFFGNHTQLNQVLLNICVNAFHAIGSKKEGKVEIEADTVSRKVLSEDSVADISEIFKSYVRFRIKDNGCGMDSHTIEQIFTPFFTTKPEGKGTGLGLSVVDQIVHAHKGYITVRSEEGKGTLFTIYIPQSEKQVISENEQENGSEKRWSILIAGANPKVVHILRRDFEKIGIRADEVSEIKDVIKSMKNKVPDILVLEDGQFDSETHVLSPDISMEVREKYPSVIQIVMSDNIRKEIVEARQKEIIDAYIIKPVSASAIIEAARKSAGEKSGNV